MTQNWSKCVISYSLSLDFAQWLHTSGMINQSSKNGDLRIFIRPKESQQVGTSRTGIGHRTPSQTTISNDMWMIIRTEFARPSWTRPKGIPDIVLEHRTTLHSSPLCSRNTGSHTMMPLSKTSAQQTILAILSSLLHSTASSLLISCWSYHTYQQPGISAELWILRRNSSSNRKLWMTSDGLSSTEHATCRDIKEHTSPDKKERTMLNVIRNWLSKFLP